MYPRLRPREDRHDDMVAHSHADAAAFIGAYAVSSTHVARRETGNTSGTSMFIVPAVKQKIAGEFSIAVRRKMWEGRTFWETQLYNGAPTLYNPHGEQLQRVQRCIPASTWSVDSALARV